MRKSLLLLVAALLAAAPAAARAEPKSAPPPAPPEPKERTEREIFVPFEDLHVVLEGAPRRVLLTREEYANLLERARREAEDRPPLEATLVAADYHVRVEEGRAVLTGRATVEVLGEGLHVVPLEVDGVGLRAARLDGRGAPIGRADDGRLTLFVEGVGSHELELEAVSALQTTAARQILSFHLPTPAATRLSLTAPGDVEVKSGAAVVSRVFDEKAGETRIALVPPRGPVTLTMTLNSHLKRKGRVVVARSVLVDEVTQAYERLSATVSFAVLHRAVDDFRFAVPAGFEITEVASPKLARWAIVEEGGRRVLEVKLREETTGAVVLTVAAVRPQPDLEAWQLPVLDPLETVGHTAVVGLLVEDRLDAEAITPTGLMSIDSSVLMQALPATVLEAEPGAPGVRPVVVYYAPQGDFGLAARFVKPPAEVLATSNVLVMLMDAGLEVRGGFALVPREEKLFALDFTVPEGWDVTAVTGESGQALGFERYGPAGEAGRIHVCLPRGLPAGQTGRVYFHAVHVPKGWYAAWDSRALDLPVFAVQGAARDVGAVAVDARDDMRVRPAAEGGLENLTPLDENEKAKYGLEGVETDLAYRYEDGPYAARLAVERIEPRLTAETYSFLRIERDAVAAHYELVYVIEGARARRLALSFPADTPTALAIRGLDGVGLKEYTSAEDGGRRVWTVLLAEARQGMVRLAVDFQQPAGAEALADFALPTVRAANVAYQSGLVAVEGSAELAVRIVEHPRKVDVGELVDAEYQPGRRLLGAYSFVGDPPPVKVAVVRHEGYGLPPAIVQRAELATQLAASGLAQSSARYLLRTKALFLEVRLPEGSTLWSAELDGTPMKPQQEGRSVLLSLPIGDAGAVRDLRVVYETPAEALGFWTGVEVLAPRLVLHDDPRDAGREVPVTDLVWTLSPPVGYDAVAAHGTVTSEAIRPPKLAATRVAEILYEVAGGVVPEYGLINLIVGGLSCADQGLRSAKYAEVEGHDGYAYDPERVPAARERAEEGSRLLAEAGAVRRPPIDERRADAAPVEAPPPAAAPPPPPEKPKAEPKKRAVWALEGARSLRIDLALAGEVLTFRSLGADPTLGVTLVREKRLEALAWAVALAVLLVGVAKTRAPAGRKVAGIVAVLLVATFLPVLPGMLNLARLTNGAFFAACLLVPYYLVAGLVRWVLAKIRERETAGAGAAGVAVLLLALLAAAPAEAVEKGSAGSEPVVVRVEPPLPPVKVPEDAIIVPYDPDDGTGVKGARRVLVPYDEFARLWALAHPKERAEGEPPPAPYALAGASLAARLEGDEFLGVEGRLEIDVFTDDYATVPLPLEGGVLVRADLDGKPARLAVATPEPAPGTKTRAARQARGEPSPMLLLYVSGKGRHVLDLTVQMKLERRGGWRVAEGRVPAAAAIDLTLTVPEPRTEVRFGDVPDRRTYETKAAGETLGTTLGAGGKLHLEWRPKVSEGQVDPSLTAESTALLDIQEDRLRLAWTLALSFRRGEREFFRLDVPEGYLVEKVQGMNVRGWEVREEGGGRPGLEVALLKEARGSETFTVFLWRSGTAYDEGPTRLDVPVVAVPGAVRHTGHLSIRRSPMLDVRTLETQGVGRTDLNGVVAPGDDRAVVDESPLGIRPYQAYAFVSVPFEIRLEVAPVEARATAEVQTILRIAERERRLESRLLLSVRGRPIYRVRAALPEALELESVTAPGTYEWGVTEEGGRRILTVYLGTGLEGEVPILLTGRLGEAREVREVEVPKLEVLGVERQQGDVVVQVDPAFDVRARGLANLESVLLQRVYGWLAGPQRKLARLALHYKDPDVAGRLELQPRRADVSCHTVTNVRVTDRAVEETILLDFAIRVAGTREIRFRLPAPLAEARISVPLLRLKTVEPVEGTDEVRVTLELQDDVMNDLRVLVEHDRLLTDQAYVAPIPVVETGRTDRRYVAVESAGRDEVVLGDPVGLEPLSRHEKEWRAVAGLLKGGATQAFIVRPGAEDPHLEFRTRERPTVRTVGARIGYAEAVLYLDVSGAYRAAQTYKVQNTTEQFMGIELPEGAALWTVSVAGELVKPVVPDTAAPCRVDVPLVKTATGDLPYDVTVKYGGRMEAPGSLEAVEFPLLRTVGLNVERSQVTLYVPPTHHWLEFGGTMQQVTEEKDLAAVRLGYLNKLTEQLVETAQFGKGFEQARSLANLKSLAAQTRQYQDALQAVDYEDNARLRSELTRAGTVLDQASEQITSADKAAAEVVVEDNRIYLNEAFQGQHYTLTRNQVTELDGNWNGDATRRIPGDKDVRFNDAWLVSNALKIDAKQAEDLERQSRVRQYAANEAPRRIDKNEEEAAQAQAAHEGQMAQQMPLQQKDIQAAFGRLKGQRQTALPEPAEAQSMAQTEGVSRWRGRKEAIQRYQEKLEAKAVRQPAADYGVTAGETLTATAAPRLAGGLKKPADLADVPVQADVTGLAPAVDTGLVSLDVRLPSPGDRWVTHRFTTPSGEARITGYAAGETLIEGLKRLGILVAAVAVVLALRAVLVRRGLSLAAQRWVTTAMIGLGVLGLLLGIFPVAALVALGIGIVWKLVLAVVGRRRERTEALA